MTIKNCMFDRKHSYFQWIFFFYHIFSVSASYNNSCIGGCVGLEDSLENVTESVQNNVSSEFNETLDEIHNISDIVSLRFLTPCETPNHEPMYCREISECPVLLAVKNNTLYADFIEASRCGPSNENKNDFRVCCGNYNSFRNLTKQTAKHSSPVPIGLPTQCGTQRIILRGRIVGGTEAALGEYPWIARIIHKNDYGRKSYGCAGFLIHRKYIITAAHCAAESEIIPVRGPPYSVVLGEHNVQTRIDCSPGGTLCAEPPQVAKINKIVVHPNYNSKSKNHFYDIALIELQKAIKLTEFIKPICLLKDADQEIKKYYISGWGKTEKSESSPIKLKVDLSPYDREECKAKLARFDLEIVDSQICAGGEKLKDSCNGDSGGPLMISPNGTQFFAAGLVSYGIGCGMEGWPGIYTSIPAYFNWVETEMLKLQISDRSNKPSKPKKKKKKNKKKSKAKTIESL